VRALGKKVQSGEFRVRGVPTSDETAALARSVGVPLTELNTTGILDFTVDGADEVDPRLNLIKGYGRALVREKIVAASSKNLVILVGDEKLVPQLGSRGKLPVEAVPFAVPLCERRLRDLGCEPTPYMRDGALFVSDNGNNIIDCQIGPIDDPARLESQIRAIPGIVSTGLFLSMADIVLVGDRNDFRLLEERRRTDSTHGD
jgi:ribose 5-phosphate isomerase A